MLPSAHAESTRRGVRPGPAGPLPPGPPLPGPTRLPSPARLPRRPDVPTVFLATRSHRVESTRGFSVLFHRSSARPRASTALSYPSFTVRDTLRHPSQERRCDFHEGPAGDVTEQKTKPQDLSRPNVQSTWFPGHLRKLSGPPPRPPPAAPPVMGGISGRRGPVPLHQAPPTHTPSLREKERPPSGPGRVGVPAWRAVSGAAGSRGALGGVLACWPWLLCPVSRWTPAGYLAANPAEEAEELLLGASHRRPPVLCGPEPLRTRAFRADGRAGASGHTRQGAGLQDIRVPHASGQKGSSFPGAARAEWPRLSFPICKRPHGKGERAPGPGSQVGRARPRCGGRASDREGGLFRASCPTPLPGARGLLCPESSLAYEVAAPDPSAETALPLEPAALCPGASGSTPPQTGGGGEGRTPGAHHRGLRGPGPSPPTAPALGLRLCIHPRLGLPGAEKSLRNVP